MFSILIPTYTKRSFLKKKKNDKRNNNVALEHTNAIIFNSI